MEKPIREQQCFELCKQPEVTPYYYDSEETAVILINRLRESGQIAGMAEVYRSAFRDSPPWYERTMCSNTDCGEFTPDESLIGAICPTCSQGIVQESYPVEELAELYLPGMIRQYSPGYLILATDPETSQVIGFMSGGYRLLGDLIQAKYGNQNPGAILAEIQERTGLSSAAKVLYRNEEAVLQRYQGNGIGTVMCEAMCQIAQKSGAENIVMRTITRPWLEIAMRKTEEFGYTVGCFVPRDDSYTGPGGEVRYLMIASN